MAAIGYDGFVEEIKAEACRRGVELPDFLTHDDWRGAWAAGLTSSEALDNSVYMEAPDPIHDGDDEDLDGEGPDADAFPA